MTLDATEARLRALLDAHERCLFVIAGSNGAGKSTFYDVYLRPLALPFVNADLIAATLPIDDPRALARAAGALAEDDRRALLGRGVTFCIETVFSDPAGAKLGLLREAQERGYAVVLIFIGIASPALSALRVAQRVAAGGHGVPLDRVEARFPRTLANLRAALRFVDEAWLIDNSSAVAPYRIIARWEHGERVWRSRRRPAWLPDDLA